MIQGLNMQLVLSPIKNVNDSSAPVELNIDELDIPENVPGETILQKAQECISKIGDIITL